MMTFKYSLVAKVVYRYANIPITLLLLLQLIISLFGTFNDIKFLLPLLINILLIFVINKFYIRMYKYFPFCIEADNEKMICTNFFLSNKKVEIKHSEIGDIKGGIFSGSQIKPLYIYDNKGNVLIGINPHLQGFNKLVTTILSNVSQKLYNALLDRSKELNVVKHEKLKGKRKNKNKKARK